MNEKTFNRNTVKISYSCTSNIKQTIHGQNKTVLAKNTANELHKKQCV